jgi:hypothetical protein
MQVRHIEHEPIRLSGIGRATAKVWIAAFANAHARFPK